MKVLRAADRVAVPWKNGGGVTREVMVWPERAGFDDFEWRVSIAEVRGAGPFSRFVGVERVLAILEGRMRLEFADRVVEIDAESAPLVFSGEESCHGTPLAGPVTDLNVMVRRARAAVERVAAGVVLSAETIFVATEAGVARAGDARVALQPLDALHWAGEEPVAVDGAGLAIRLSAPLAPV